MPPKPSTSSQIEVSREPSIRPVCSAQTPPITTAAIPDRIEVAAIMVTWADRSQTIRPRASTRLARSA